MERQEHNMNPLKAAAYEEVQTRNKQKQSLIFANSSNISF